jgi:hypothetical protein
LNVGYKDGAEIIYITLLILIKKTNKAGKQPLVTATTTDLGNGLIESWFCISMIWQIRK